MQATLVTLSHSIRLAGYAANASLNEDIEQQIVVGLRSKLSSTVAGSSTFTGMGMYLVQTYPEGEWTPDTVYGHMVGAPVDEDTSLLPGMVEHRLPAGAYLTFEHDGPESEIDGLYEEIQAWLADNGYDEPRSFDFEQWIDQPSTELAMARIVIYIPV